MVDISEKNFEQTIEAVLIGEASQQMPGGASPAKESGGEYGPSSRAAIGSGCRRITTSGSV